MSKKAVMSPGSTSGDGDHMVFPKDVADKKVIELLFDKLGSDPKISPFWTGQSARDLKEQAEIVLEIAFGEGPAGISPDDARYVHDPSRQMKELHFDQFVKSFKETLNELNKQANIIPQDKCKEAIDNMAKFKKQFVK